MLVAQLYPTLWDPMDCSLPGSSIHGILQARTLEWVAIPFSKGSSQSRDQTRSPALQADSLPSKPREKPEFSKTDLKMESQCSKRKTAQKLPPRRRKMTRLTARTHASYGSRAQSPSGQAGEGTPTSPARSITHPTKAAGMVCS